MNMLVFGKNGQVGTALQKVAPDYQIRLVLAGRNNLDLEKLTTPDPIIHLIDQHGVQAILNASAYTAVDKAENDQERAYAVNAKAPGYMAEACLARNIPLVHVSTDFVFDGSATAPYKENDPTGPLGVYGRTKLAGEDSVIQSGCTRAILRTSWVFSETGNNFVKTMLRVGAERDTMTVVADQHGIPTPAGAISIAMLSIATTLQNDPTRSGTYHFAGDEPTSWAGFARAIFEEAGMSTQVTDITTDQYPTAATRPSWSVLDCSRIRETFGIPQPSWRTALRHTIAQLKQA